MKRKYPAGVRSWLLVLCMVMVMTVANTSVVSAKTEYTGWRSANNCKYYYKKGKKVTGWKKISGRYYYFNGKGRLQTNKIVGSKSSGYYYVDKSGVRVTDALIKRAVSFVRANSKASDSNSKRLKKCFKALCKYRYIGLSHGRFSSSDIKRCATKMFKYKYGDCVSYAASFAYIARVLGYDTRVADGGVTAYRYRNLSAHTWCEVKIGGKWKMADCSMQRAHRDANLYLVTRKAYPYRLRCDDVLTMQVSKGKVRWK